MNVSLSLACPEFSKGRRRVRRTKAGSEESKAALEEQTPFSTSLRCTMKNYRCLNKHHCAEAISGLGRLLRNHKHSSKNKHFTGFSQ